MSCITSCLDKVFFCICCKKKKEMPKREGYSVSEAKVEKVADTIMKVNTKPLVHILKKKSNGLETVDESSGKIEKATHNRFMSTEVISLNTALRQ